MMIRDAGEERRGEISIIIEERVRFDELKESLKDRPAIQDAVYTRKKKKKDR
jgi:hypothetical protein